MLRSTLLYFYGIMALVLLSGCAHRDSGHRKSFTKAASVPILLYHHIEELPPAASHARKRWTLAPRKFEAQMDWVARQGFHPITAQQLIAHLRNGDALPSKPIVLTFDDGWKDHYSTVLPILQKHDFVATFFIVTGSVGNSASMTWDEVKALSDADMDIQSHTVSHPRLSTLSYKKARHEIFDSKSVLEEKLNKPVTVLAYPYGKYDEEVITIAKEAGMEGAVAVSGLNVGYLLRTDASYTLERYAVEGDEKIEDIAERKGFASL